MTNDTTPPTPDELHMLLSVLRNPAGATDEYLRWNRLRAADLLEAAYPAQLQMFRNKAFAGHPKGSFTEQHVVTDVAPYRHVYPTWGRKHDLSPKCWCNPEVDTERPEVLIHNPET
jgi:hypothetical protein